MIGGQSVFSSPAAIMYAKMIVDTRQIMRIAVLNNYSTAADFCGKRNN